MKNSNNSIYEGIKRILSTPLFRIFAVIFSHGATHLVFLFIVGAFTAYMWILNNREDITPHNLGIHIGWASNKSDDIQSIDRGFTPKDSIDNIKVHILLNSEKINNRTNGKFQNGIIVEFDGKARIRDFVDGPSKQLITSYRDSVVVSLYSEPTFNSYDAMVKFDPFPEGDVEHIDSLGDDGTKYVIAKKHVPVGLAQDSVVPHHIYLNKDNIVNISMFPADYMSVLGQRTRNLVYFYSDEIGFRKNSPYYYYYFNIPPAKNAEIASIDFQFSDLIENEKFGMKYTKGKNLQFKYIYPEPDIIGNGRVEYISEKKKQEIQKNQGIIIQAVDIDALNRQNKLAFLYSVFIGTGVAFLLDIIIQLIRELRRLQKKDEES